MWVDMNPFGNTATSVQSIERCRRVTAADSIFDVDIVAYNLAEFQKMLIFLAFDPAYVDVIDVDWNYMLLMDGGTACVNSHWEIVDGNVLKIYAQRAPGGGGSGTGVLARVTFMAKAPLGQSGFDVINDPGHTTELTPGGGGDCMVMNWGPPLTVDLSPAVGQAYIDPTGTIGCWAVTSTADVVDGSAGDGICDADPTPGIVECTLRAAIEESNARPGANRVSFRIPDESRTCGPPCTIGCPTLPPLSDTSGGTTLDGTTHPSVVVDAFGGGADAIRINSNGNVVQSLTIQRAFASGIRINLADNNKIFGCNIGTDHLGWLPFANGVNGIEILGGSNNEIGGAGKGNLIAAHTAGCGIKITGGTGNLIQGNTIGLDAFGNPMGNAQGVVFWASNSNTIGGATAAVRNLISGNGIDGILLILGSTMNVIEGNFIGLNAFGAPCPNWTDGVAIGDSPNNRIGDATLVPGAPPGNVISYNGRHGVSIEGEDADANYVLGNAIGMNPALTAPAANGDAGVRINAGADNNIVGSMGHGNVISGNTGNGVEISDFETTGNAVRSNLIGLDGSGAVAIGNTIGVYIHDGAQSNWVGGSLSGEGNVISGNNSAGVEIAGESTENNRIELNIIGADMNRTQAVPNNQSGVLIRHGAQFNTVVDNRIEGNTPHGVHVMGSIISSNASRNEILDNFVGSLAIPNAQDGVHIGPVAPLNQVTLNTIGNNADDGVEIEGDESDGNSVFGNSVIGNGGSGVRISSSADDNVVGGFIPQARNLIQGNVGSGIRIESGTGNGLYENSISLNGGLGIDLGASGVTPNDGAPDPDTGANNLQNYPVLTSATLSAGTTTIVGTLTSAPNTGYRVEFFTGAACDPSGFGEGDSFLDVVFVTTDGGGTAAINAVVGGAVLGNLVTATATDTTSHDTSEFSACVPIELGPSTPANLAIRSRRGNLVARSEVFAIAANETTLVGDTLSYNLVASNEGPGGATGVAVQDTLPDGVTFVSSETSQGTCTGTSIIDCDLGSMAGGDTVLITILVIPTEPGTIVNVATIDGNETDPDTTDNVTRDTTLVVLPPTGVRPRPAPVAERLWLGQNIPNPFNPTTTIPFSLPGEATVTLAIYDTGGRLVRILLHEARPAGVQEVTWDGRDRRGHPVSTGLYFYALETPWGRTARRMVLLK